MIFTTNKQDVCGVLEIGNTGDAIRRIDFHDVGLTDIMDSRTMREGSLRQKPAGKETLKRVATGRNMETVTE